MNANVIRITNLISLRRMLAGFLLALAACGGGGGGGSQSESCADLSGGWLGTRTASGEFAIELPIPGASVLQQEERVLVEFEQSGCSLRSERFGLSGTVDGHNVVLEGPLPSHSILAGLLVCTSPEGEGVELRGQVDPGSGFLHLDGVIEGEVQCTSSPQDPTTTVPIPVQGEAAFALTKSGGRSVPLEREVVEMAGHPDLDLAYLVSVEPAALVVVDDMGVQTELELPEAPSDIDISPNGSTLAIGHGAAKLLTTIDTATLDVVHMRTGYQTDRVEISGSGQILYADYAAEYFIRRDGGAFADEEIAFRGTSQTDLELGRNDGFVWVGEPFIGEVERWAYPFGSSFPAGISYEPRLDYARRLLLSPGGHHVYYGGWQFVADDLEAARGELGEDALAADHRGQLVLGETALFDADTLLPLFELPGRAYVAALSRNDGVLRFWDRRARRLYWLDVNEAVASGGVSR